MEEEARAAGIRFRTAPVAVVLNQIDEKAIVLRWMLDHDTCPFLSSGNDCSIYSERPLTCRAFPLCVSGKDLLLLGVKFCQGLQAITLGGKKRLRRRETLGTFKKPREYAIVEHTCMDTTFEILRRLQKKGLFIPALGLDTGYVRMITDARSIDVFDFAVEKGLMTSEDLHKMSQTDDFLREPQGHQGSS